MDVLILAAGYGTRLQRDIQNDITGKYSHLKGLPKALLPIGNKGTLFKKYHDDEHKSSF